MAAGAEIPHIAAPPPSRGLPWNGGGAAVPRCPCKFSNQIQCPGSSTVFGHQVRSGRVGRHRL